jgi:hypothetical protein
MLKTVNGGARRFSPVLNNGSGLGKVLISFREMLGTWCRLAHIISRSEMSTFLNAGSYLVVLTNPRAVATILPHLVTGDNSMKKRSLILRTFAIANALLVTVAFVGCPARKDPSIVTIAPPPPLVTIAPYGGNFQNLLPSNQTTPATSQEKSDKRSP